MNPDAVMTALDWWLVVLAAILVGAVYAWLVTDVR
jgi:hypothetical protein